MCYPKGPTTTYWGFIYVSILCSTTKPTTGPSTVTATATLKECQKFFHSRTGFYQLIVVLAQIYILSNLISMSMKQSSPKRSELQNLCHEVVAYSSFYAQALFLHPERLSVPSAQIWSLFPMVLYFCLLGNWFDYITYWMISIYYI